MWLDDVKPSSDKRMKKPTFSVDAPVAADERSINNYRQRRGIPANLDGYRAKFRHHLSGQWTTWFETSPAPVDTWEFYADGTARVFMESGSGSHEVAFRWEKTGDERTIRLREMDRKVDEDETQDSEEWSILRYDFKVIEHYGPTVVLFQVPEKATFKFWFTTQYLRFTGDIQSKDAEAAA